MPAGREGWVKGEQDHALGKGAGRSLLPALVQRDSSCTKQKPPGISARNSSRTAASTGGRNNRAEKGSSTSQQHLKETLLFAASIPISCLTHTLPGGLYPGTHRWPSPKDPSPALPVPTTVRWVLAVMLATMLVATHSHSPWSSLPRERICRVPPGSVLCLLLLGFPTLGKEQGGAGQREKKNTTQKRVVGQGEAAVGSLSYLRGPGDTAGHRQGIWSLRSRQGSRFPRFREDLAGQRKKHASGRLMLSTRTQAENPTALTRTPSPAPGLNLRHPKPKPLRREVYWPPLANTLPGQRRHRLPQEMPKLPLSLSQRQRRGRTLHIRGLGSKGPTGTQEDGVRGGAQELSKPSRKMELVTTHVYAQQPKLCKSHVVPSPLQPFFTQGSLLIDTRIHGSMPRRTSRGVDGHVGLPVPSPSCQESFKRLVSAGGLTGSEGACFCHWETEPSPSQP